MTIKCTSNISPNVVYGEITWIEENGKHKVRSPVVISNDFKY